MLPEDDNKNKASLKQVLVVEDESHAREALGKGLAQSGFKVIEAVGVEDAIRVASSKSIDFAVIDIVLDGNRDGIEVARKIQSIQPDVPVFFVSAYGDEQELRKRANQSGIRVENWLSNPSGKMDRLLESIQQHIKAKDTAVSEETKFQNPSTARPSPTVLSFSIDKLSSNARDAISRAEQFRRSMGRDEIHLEHLIVGLYDAEKGQARQVFDRAPMSRGELRASLHSIRGADIPAATPYAPYRINDFPPLSQDTVGALNQAIRFHGNMEVVFTEDLLKASLSIPESRVSAFLREQTSLGRALGLKSSTPSLLSTEEEDHPEAPLGSAPEPLPADSILLASASDQPTLEDQLGFKPYVWAIAEFLASQDTKPPLTLSIEGAWGCGKSSFMLQLEERLHSRADAFGGEKRLSRRLWMLLRSGRKEWLDRARQVLPNRCLTIRFNAWRHDKEEALWAAFALEFLQRIAGQRFFLRRWWGHLQLFIGRYQWRSGWFDLMRWVGVWSFILFLAVAVPLAFWLSRGAWGERLDRALQEFGIEEAHTPQQEEKEVWREVLAGLIAIGGAGAYYAGLAAIALKAKELIGNSLEVNLRQYLGSPDYENRVAFVERFHEDFRRIVDAYAGEHKVYIFIDDLDRCEVPKAADLMQSLNLLITDDPRLIFIAGMDREKVAAGLAVKYEKLLPYLMAGPAPEGVNSTNSEASLRRFGREYGYSFLEKFIQLPFRVPSPLPEDLGRFLWPGAPPLPVLSPNIHPPTSSRGEPSSMGGSATQPGESGRTSELAPSTLKADTSTQRKRAERAQFEFGKDSDAVRQAAFMVAPVLDYNPRRLKQFINLFRLKAYIANEVGLFDEQDGQPQLTLEQLAKFVAAGLVWPGVLTALEERPNLLERLEGIAEKRLEQKDLDYVERCWWDESRLQSLLRYGLRDGAGQHRSEGWRYSLSRVKMEKLLRVCPQVVSSTSMK